MACPICKQDTFIEMSAGENSSYFMDGGWSIKECLNCDYKVEDKTLDGRFIGIDHVITKPDMEKVRA